MPQTVHLGLCSSCRHNAVCVFTRNKKCSPVYCEEFQLEISGAVHLPQNDDSKTSGAPDGEALALHQGLCCDCENRHTCGLISTPEGGVWYCEEYR
jgi:hypothetical protein